LFIILLSIIWLSRLWLHSAEKKSA
jgi:hypothetical protein